MKDIESLSHSKWRCQYHIVFAPKYRRQEIYGKIKADIGQILRKLCEQKGGGNNRSQRMSGSYTYAGEYTAITERGPIHGISERKKQPDDIRPTCQSKI